MSDLLVVLVIFGSGALANALTPPSKRWRGRHISRPLVRRFGAPRARFIWLCLLLLRLMLIGAAITGAPSWPWIVVFVLETARDVDDWLYPDDDDDRRDDRFRARVRLRMPKPVLLRPVERVGATT